MPLRWGPPKREPGAPKPRITTGTFAILWSFIVKPKTNGHGNGHGKP